MAGKFVVNLTHAKNDPDKATVAFVVANAAAASDKDTVVFLSIDTPRRNPTDIIFVDPNDGSPATFMARNAE